MTTEELRESLLAAPKNGYAALTQEQRVQMEDYCKRYAAFMDACKTEREATTWAVEIADSNLASHLLRLIVVTVRAALQLTVLLYANSCCCSPLTYQILVEC